MKIRMAFSTGIPILIRKSSKHASAGLKDVPEENIFLGNGSDEIIDLCFRIFCNPGKDKALIFTPTYGMYEVSAAVNDVGLIKIPLNDDFQINVGRCQIHGCQIRN